ncbi:hypothetical protein V0U79_04575 [Hyphobacterium sp. HN65]|uniref:Uncharacterized protein n=1 Tax=Hyphobacterium lacteum TaxID=3116575 RepID=A0ABU7LPU2_9PROT|nr:hypothetical protein [Hyphobacterium sp. HN65]MEE2525631.1 hypothetical protein [Hyphobacterium sp. HN65]
MAPQTVAQWRESRCARIRLIGDDFGAQLASHNTVVLEAVYRGLPQCVPVDQMQDQLPGMDELESVCSLGPFYEITDSAIVRLISSRPSTNYEASLPPELRAATVEEREAVLAEFDQLNQPFRTRLDDMFPADTQAVVLVGIENENLAAVCETWSPEGQPVVTPFRFSHLDDALGNDYTCYRAEWSDEFGWSFAL